MSSIKSCSERTSFSSKDSVSSNAKEIMTERKRQRAQEVREYKLALRKVREQQKEEFLIKSAQKRREIEMKMKIKREEKEKEEMLKFRSKKEEESYLKEKLEREKEWREEQEKIKREEKLREISLRETMRMEAKAAAENLAMKEKEKELEEFQYKKLETDDVKNYRTWLRYQKRMSLQNRALFEKECKMKLETLMDEQEKEKFMEQIKAIELFVEKPDHLDLSYQHEEETDLSTSAKSSSCNFGSNKENENFININASAKKEEKQSEAYGSKLQTAPHVKKLDFKRNDHKTDLYFETLIKNKPPSDELKMSKEQMKLEVLRRLSQDLDTTMLSELSPDELNKFVFSQIELETDGKSTGRRSSTTFRFSEIFDDLPLAPDAAGEDDNTISKDAFNAHIAEEPGLKVLADSPENTSSNSTPKVETPAVVQTRTEENVNHEHDNIRKNTEYEIRYFPGEAKGCKAGCCIIM